METVEAYLGKAASSTYGDNTGCRPGTSSQPLSVIRPQGSSPQNQRPTGQPHPGSWHQWTHQPPACGAFYAGSAV